MPEQKPIVIGVGGFARSGKDTFVKIARKILKEHGYSSMKLAFADALKEEIDPFLVTNYGISAWTDDTEQKKIIRPFLVAHGCGKRQQSNGQYWVDKIDREIEGVRCEDVIFISDCRFPNEVDWVHQKWGGWFVHVKKFSVVNEKEWVVDYENSPEGIEFSCHPDCEEGVEFKEVEKRGIKVFDEAPNDEEATNDPICERKADYRLAMENAIERELRVNGNKITVDSLVDNTYLNEEIKLCLSKCPLLTLE